MVRWNSSPHPISDIRDWKKSGHLEIKPDFQRREVWSAPARIMLMDTIIRGIPMPKIFLATEIQDDQTYRIVIDGQQRITAILDFLSDKFSLEKPFLGDEKGKKFSELSRETKDQFLSYQIDFNEAVNPTDQEQREVYARVNKYTVPLNKQELRRADFPGDFLSVSEELATYDYFDQIRIFTPANRRRCADVEYVSELLAAIIDGVQDKKTTLDKFYINFADWEEDHKKQIVGRFKIVLRELNLIFDDSHLPLSTTRFRQKADFYTLFLVVYDYVSDGWSVENKNLEHLRQDLNLLDYHIRPEATIDIFREYAIKCVSQANSASSRRWRHKFLRTILAGTYGGPRPDEESNKLLYEIMENLHIGEGHCPLPELECPVCNEELSGEFNDWVLGWVGTDDVFQISNAYWLHRSCKEIESSYLIFFLDRPDGASRLSQRLFE